MTRRSAALASVALMISLSAFAEPRADQSSYITSLAPRAQRIASLLVAAREEHRPGDEMSAFLDEVEKELNELPPCHMVFFDPGEFQRHATSVEFLAFIEETGADLDAELEFYAYMLPGAVGHLGIFQTQRSIELLERALLSGHCSVVGAALLQLPIVGDPKYVPMIEKIGRESPPIRNACALALARFDTDEATQAATRLVGLDEFEKLIDPDRP